MSGLVLGLRQFIFTFNYHFKLDVVRSHLLHLSSYEVASCELAGEVPELFQGFSLVFPTLYPTVLAVPWFMYIEAPSSSLGWQVESPVVTSW